MLKTLPLTVVLCIVATVIIRHGPLEPSGTGERIAIAVVWTLGLAWILKSLAAKFRPRGATRK